MPPPPFGAPFGPGMMAPGPGPAMPGGPGGGTYGPSPFSRAGIIKHIRSGGTMSPASLFTWQRMGFMPSHAANILARLQQSGCCPGARTTGGTQPHEMTQRGITCNNGNIYRLENYFGGVRARRVIGSGPAQCDRIYEGTWFVRERGRGAQGLGAAAKEAAYKLSPAQRALSLAISVGLLYAGFRHGQKVEARTPKAGKIWPFLGWSLLGPVGPGYLIGRLSG
jgi:hypothetical protein